MVKPQEVVPFVVAGVIGLLAVVLPGPETDWVLFGIAAAMTAGIAVAGLAGAVLRRGRFLVVALPLAYFVVVGLLRHSGTTGASGFAPLVMLPIVWLALFGTRRELVIGLVAMALVQLVPFLAFGEPRYPATGWRSTLLFVVVAALTGLSIQALVVSVRAARDRLSGVLDASTEIAIIATDPDGVITVFNTGAERMLGYSARELVGTAKLDTFNDARELGERAAELGIEPGFEVLVHSARLGTPEYRFWTYVRKDGTRTAVSLTTTAERERDGTLTGFLGLAKDVSDRRRAEAAVKAERDFSAAVVDTAGSLVMVLDPDGRIERFNHACEELTGRTEAEVRGRVPSEFAVAPEDVEHVNARFERAAPEDFPLSFEVEWLTAAGEHRLIAWSNTCLRDGDGGIAHIVAAGTDITVRREALARAVEASRAKSDFLANMSHEIRTPLNGVIGMLELLSETELDTDQREYVRTAVTSGDHLLGVIADILDFSKIEAGRLELDDHDFDLRQVVEDAVEMLAPQAHSKGIELTAWIDEQVPPLVRGDGIRLRQVLANLLSNAVKFTPAGEVSVRVGAEPADGRVRVRAEVADTGIGIDPDRLAALFEPFSQAETSTTRRFGGTGLGLAISRQLVELMGGELTAESAPGEGSTFAFTVAVAASAGDRPTRRGRIPVPDGLRVLVVDDSATNREILRGYLDPRVTRCEEAETGQDALVMLHAAANAGEPYELVVLDYHMPGMDGLELAQAIRRAPSLRSARLVMLTSTATHRAAAHEARIDGYLTKPVRRAALLETVADALAPSRPAELPAETAAPPPPPAAAAACGRVLVAEDNPVNQLVIAEMLARRGYDADVVDSGLRALEALDRERHDAVLMDVQMPELDGYETTARIRAQERDGDRLPVIALTAGAMEGDRERALEAGMDDYLSKPLRPDQLDAVLERWVRPAEAEAAPPAEPLIDTARIDMFCTGYPGVVDRLVALFADSTPPLLEELAAAAGAGDAERVRALAHKLAGACDNVGAARMAALCRALQEPGGDHMPLAEELSAAYAPTLTEIRRAAAA